MKSKTRRTVNSLLRTRYISVSGAPRLGGSSRRSGDPGTAHPPHSVSTAVVTCDALAVPIRVQSANDVPDN